MATRRSAKPLCAGSIPAYASRKPPARGVFWRRASKLLCLRAEIEQRNYVLLANKTNELVPRQIFVTTKI